MPGDISLLFPFYVWKLTGVVRPPFLLLGADSNGFDSLWIPLVLPLPIYAFRR